MAGEDGQPTVEQPQQQQANGHAAAVAALRSPSRKRRKSDSLQAAEASPSTPTSAASTASSLNALADATVSLGSAAPLAETTSGEQLTVIERMQRQIEVEREAREAAELEARRLEEHVQRLEQNNKHAQQTQQQQQQHSQAATAPHTPNMPSQSAPSTPSHHSFAVPVASSNGTAVPSPSSPFISSPSSSHMSPVSSALDGVPHAARGVLAADLGKLFPSVSDDDGDERGVSCHQCKSNKPRHLLLFCTTKADSSGRKRRCRKKYCDACLRRSYHQVISHMSAEDLISWRCPSCLNSCTCAACLRRGGVGSSPSSTAPSASPSAAPSASSSAVTSPTQKKATAGSIPPTHLTSAAPVATTSASSHQSASAPSTPVVAPSAPAAPPTLLQGFPYPLAMSGMPTAIPVPFAFQPFAFRPAMVAAAAAAAAAAASASASAAHMQSSPPSLSVPTSPAANGSNMLHGLLPPHLHPMNGMAPFSFPLMAPPHTVAAPPSSFASSASSTHPQLVINGVRSAISQPMPQHARQNKAVTAAEATQARNGEAQSAAAAG